MRDQLGGFGTVMVRLDDRNSTLRDGLGGKPGVFGGDTEPPVSDPLQGFSREHLAFNRSPPKFALITQTCALINPHNGGRRLRNQSHAIQTCYA